MTIMMLIATMSTALMVWSVTGTPVRLTTAAFSGFACGYSWALVYAMHVIEKAKL